MEVLLLLRLIPLEGTLCFEAKISLALKALESTSVFAFFSFPELLT